MEFEVKMRFESKLQAINAYSYVQNSFFINAPMERMIFINLPISYTMMKSLAYKYGITLGNLDDISRFLDIINKDKKI